jgi:hypothetical protein
MSKTFALSLDEMSGRTLFSAVAAFMITLVCWSLSNPAGSTPDEWFHLANIWCANGVSLNSCAGTSSGVTTANIDISSCIFTLASEVRQCSNAVWVESNIRGENYPNGIYQVLNFFIPLGASVNILAMRIFGGFVASILLIAQFYLIKTENIATWLSGFTLTLVPMGLFLVSSLHPSGWALTAGAHGWMFLITALTSSKDERLKRFLAIAGWFFCGFICILSRYDAFMFFLATSVLTNIFAVSFYWKKYQIRKLFFIVFTLITLGLIFLFQRFNILFSLGLFNPGPGQLQNKYWSLAWLIRTIAIPVEIFGKGEIAQQGIDMPPVVWILGIAVVASMLIFALININFRQVSAILSSFALLFITVLWLNNLMYRDVINLNGRYVIPLVPFFIGLWFYTSKSPIQFMEIRELRKIGIVLLGIAHSISLHTVLDTFVDGQSFSFLPIDVGTTGWWWVGLPIGPNFVWLLGSISFVYFLRKLWSFVPYVELRTSSAASPL